MPQQEVYADLYFFVNASMDLLCLNLTALLLHHRPKRWRLFAGAALGGAFSVGVLLLGMSGVWEILLDFFGAAGICAAVFAGRPASLRRGAQTVGAFFLVSVLLGGVMTALFWLLNRLNLPIDAVTEDHISVWLFAVLALVSGLLTSRGGRLLGRSAKAKTVTLNAVLFGKPVTLRALVDTGNLLVDPLSGRPVILCDFQKLREILPHALFLPPGDPIRLRLEEDLQIARRVRLIPSASATGEQLLTAVIPESLQLTDEGGSHPGNHLIALAKLEGRALGFDALIGN